MFEAKRSKKIKFFWAVISLMVIFSMIAWTVGIAFMN